MNIKNKKGITLVALVVTIIVLLILAGIATTILNNLIIDKVILASNRTIDSLLQEKIEIAWIDCTASYYKDARENPNIDKQEYFNEKFLQNLQNIEDLKNVSFNRDENANNYITFKYKNKEYKFAISENGKTEPIYLLKGNVKVGDYIEYSIEYDDVFSTKHYTTTTGWRVIDDGIMKGTSGKVRIISAGIPAKWQWDYNTSKFENNQDAVYNLINNFENLDLIDRLGEISMKGKYFKDEAVAEKVTTISLSDVNHVYNKLYNSKRKVDDISDLENKNELFYMENFQVYYWLATNNTDNDKNIYYILNGKIEEDLELRGGIRPVICLKDNLSGTISSGVWKIIK